MDKKTLHERLSEPVFTAYTVALYGTSWLLAGYFIGLGH